MRRFFPPVLTLALLLVGCEAATTTEPTSDETPTDTRPPPGSITFTRPNTFFISRQSTVAANGGSFTQGFSVTGTASFVMRYASDFRVQIAIMRASDVTDFQNGNTVSVFHVWPGGSGTESITLAAGAYAVGIRNFQSVSQAFSIELDHAVIDLPDEFGYTFSFASRIFVDSRTIPANGGWRWQGFTIQEGFRYLMDGTNTRVHSWIIPQSEIPAFESGGSFQFFSAFEGTNPGAPGLWEIDLPPGNYALAMRATDSRVDGLVTYDLEAWRIR